MALPTIIAGLTKLFTTAFRYRMEITRQFQERMSELGMALFILSNTKEWETAADFLKLQEMVIKAYCKYLSLPTIYCLFGEEIIKTPLLSRFFDDFRSFAEFKEYYERTGKTYNEEIPKVKQLENLIKTTPIPGLINSISKYVNNPTELWIDLSREILRMFEAKNKGTHELLLYIDQHFKDAPSPIEECLPPPTLAILIHPTIGLDWTVIKAFIATQMAYIDYFNAQEEALVRRPHLWYGTRNVWGTTEVGGHKYLKIIRGTFEEPIFWVGEHETISAVRGWGKNQKQYDLKITNIQDVAKLNFMLTGDLKLKEYMPKAKRFFLTINADDVFDEYTFEKEDIKEVKIKLEHEGVFSNEVLARFQKNVLRKWSLSVWTWEKNELEYETLPYNNGIIKIEEWYGWLTFYIKPGYAFRIKFKNTPSAPYAKIGVLWDTGTEITGFAEAEFQLKGDCEVWGHSPPDQWKVRIPMEDTYWTNYKDEDAWIKEIDLFIYNVGAWIETKELEKVEEE